MSEASKHKTFYEHFPTPEFLLFSNSSVVISDEDIRFVKFERGFFSNGLRLSHAVSKPHPAGALQAALSGNGGEVVSNLKGLASRYDTRYVWATLPDDKAYIFTALIDRVAPENLRDAVAFIIEENAPVSIAEAVFDFDVISEDRSAGKIKIAVSVLPKNVVEAYINLLESAGLTPVSFDVESQAIARSLVPAGRSGPCLIVNLSAGKTGFYVVEKQAVQFSTTSSVGIEDDEQSGLDKLCPEVKKVIDFWNDRANPLLQDSGEAGSDSTKPVARIILCGSRALNKSFVEKLARESGIPCVSGDVWVNVPLAKGYKPTLSSEESLGWASAIGLCLSRAK